jgi:predicted DNA binding CopG/RHH family protein
MQKNRKQINKIPDFTSKDDEAKFWETHHISDFLDEFEPIKAVFDKNLSEGITIRFDKSTLHRIREMAREKGIGPTTLARMWIMDHLRQQPAVQ